MKNLFIITILRKLLNDTSGATLVEYGIALAMAITVGTLGLIALGGEVVTKIGTAQGVF